MAYSESPLRIVFFTVHAAFFVSHRLNLALAARAQGHKVLVLYGMPGSKEMTDQALRKLNELDLVHHQISFNSRRFGVINLISGFFALRRETLQFSPTTVHAISTIPILLMLFATIGVRCRRIFAVSGLGTLAKKKYLPALRILLNYAVRPEDIFIYQNQSDPRVLRLNKCKSIEIPGSGTPQRSFDASKKERIVLFAARLMRDKGVAMFCSVAGAVRKYDKSIRFVLAGAADYDHPDAISLRELKNFPGFSDVEFVGYREDISELFRQASIVMYPSMYAEGLSKTLIESAMYSCVILTYNREGCKEAVIDEVTGVLLKPGARETEFADVIFNLFNPCNAGRLEQMMVAANKMARERFSLNHVTQRHLDLYNNGN